MYILKTKQYIFYKAFGYYSCRNQQPCHDSVSSHESFSNGPI